jgi:hypothetical protein
MEMKHLDYNIKNGVVFFNVPKSEEDKIISYTLDGNLFYHDRIPSHYSGGFSMTHTLIPIWEKNPSMNLEIKWHTFKDNKKINTELFYIHPMKTGGSSIESVGFDYGVEWGWLYKWGTNESFEPHKSSFYFTQLDYLKDKVLFTSVRNPYNRMVSFFYNLISLQGYIKQIKTKEDFNNKLKELIKQNNEGMVPCYDFVYHNDKKVIPHVIKMEDGLNEGFDKLMFEYNCPVRLNNTHVNKAPSKEKKWDVNDINPANIDLINKRYEKDFEYFGYTMK